MSSSNITVRSGVKREREADQPVSSNTSVPQPQPTTEVAPVSVQQPTEQPTVVTAPVERTSTDLLHPSPTAKPDDCAPPPPKKQKTSATQSKPFTFHTGSRAQSRPATAPRDVYIPIAAQVNAFHRSRSIAVPTFSRSTSVATTRCPSTPRSTSTAPSTPFNFRTANRAGIHPSVSSRDPNETECTFKPKIHSFDKNRLGKAGEIGVPRTAPKSTTVCREFKFMQRENAKAEITKKRDEFVTLQNAAHLKSFRANPMPQFRPSKVFQPTLEHKQTTPEPFQFKSDGRTRGVNDSFTSDAIGAAVQERIAA